MAPSELPRVATPLGPAKGRISGVLITRISFQPKEDTCHCTAIRPEVGVNHSRNWQGRSTIAELRIGGARRSTVQYSELAKTVNDSGQAFLHVFCKFPQDSQSKENVPS
ncbi:hypothetical protein Nepgr_021162 [Nepenthes gracilis]|uniref:Uncharacterized protein n=1 Tax=Nepenthes gracilis TaxID=150966 RepID=A0AAD3XX32_NEPGR|nr:hypothetical protein Nepgr_021162 [Nepenthes gracilis]